MSDPIIDSLPKLMVHESVDMLLSRIMIPKITSNLIVVNLIPLSFPHIISFIGDICHKPDEQS